MQLHHFLADTCMRGSMELKKTHAMNGHLFTVLFLLVLVSPCISKDETEVSAAGEEIDQVDYRGPETHSFIPPPRSKFGPHKYTTMPMLDLRSNGLQSDATATPLLGRKGACREDGSVIVP